MWLSQTDIANAYKPLKMGIRVSNLNDSWNEFVHTYDRVQKTSELLLRISLSEEEREADLDTLKRLRDIMKRHQIVHDTSLLLNHEI